MSDFSDTLYNVPFDIRSYNFQKHEPASRYGVN